MVVQRPFWFTNVNYVNLAKRFKTKYARILNSIVFRYENALKATSSISLTYNVLRKTSFTAMEKLNNKISV